MMNFYSILFIAVSLLSSLYNDEDKIIWSETKRLEWSDFKGIPIDSLNTAVAQIQGSIEIVDIPVVNDIPTPMVHCYFIKSKSWTKVDDIETLNHEQLHFDIYELYARKMRKGFHKLNSKRITDIEEYQKVYDKYINECIDYNTLYDTEVYFSDVEQKNWIHKVTTQLKYLKQYKLVNEKIQ